MSGPDILSVGVVPLITQAESIVTQITHADPLAGEDRIARGLRALGEELAALAARARTVCEEREVARRWAAVHAAAGADQVDAVRAWRVEVRTLLDAARRSTPALAVEVDVMLALLAHRPRHLGPTQAWLAEVAPMIAGRAPVFADVADGVLADELRRAEALAARLAEVACEAAQSAEHRGVWAVEAEALRLSLREAIRRTRLAWRTAQRRLPGLPALDLTTVAAAAARGRRSGGEGAREHAVVARDDADMASEGIDMTRETADTASDVTAMAREEGVPAREGAVMAREGVAGPC